MLSQVEALERDLHRPLFIISMDTDWCPVEVLDYVLREIIDPRLPLTLFATGIYASAAARPATEIALHYNVDNMSFAESFRKIGDLVPGARGARGHSLAFSERLRSSWNSYQIAYDSSYIMYQQHDITPFPIAQGVIELPIYFMDMFAMEYEQDNLERFPDMKQMCLPGLKLYDFHPIHLLLNTPSREYYFDKKQSYHDFKQLLRHQYQGYGVRSYFEEVQQWILDGGHACTTCMGAYESYVAQCRALSSIPAYQHSARPGKEAHLDPDDLAISVDTEKGCRHRQASKGITL